MSEQGYRTLSAICLAAVMASIAMRPSIGWGGMLVGVGVGIGVGLAVRPRDMRQRRAYLRPGGGIGRWGLFLPACGSLGTLVGEFTEANTNFAVSILLFVGIMLAAERYFMAIDESVRRAE
ncbi:hypothetical protein [Zhihengliuella halotolerans]|uniref:Uncharacterized protein n=1 Tax=Zhihengliuella halotolerans TaxID=370736 RepID=A0A4Q8AHY0_9MICC|nr:hypothetical protein [Zhihengliuella halotolerans]RZU63521.1 hypothetical protein EV380_3142 [Zhihengliuella halotolerans]